MADSASPTRKAQAKQLRGYLMFFDRLMANHLAQLAHVKDLFSHEDIEARTYFSQAVEQPGAASTTLRTGPGDQEILTSSLAAGRSAGAAVSLDMERRNRFSNHLLSRFAETLDDHGTTPAEADVAFRALADRKQTFLQRYPHLGGARGAAISYLDPVRPSDRTALGQRIELKLGLTAEECPIVVEHILLRPMEGDDHQQVPLLTASLSKDPYSLQLTFVLPSWGRFAEQPGSTNDFRTLVEHTIREETPAHLTAYVRWMAADEWEVFRTVHAAWLDRRREYWAEQLSVPLNEGP